MSDASPQSAPAPTAAPSSPIRARYRVRFAKHGLLRWISHRDLARLWERLVRRAALRLSMSEGFHPKPRIGFPSALALGVTGLDEVVELELAEEMSPSELLQRLQADDQPGLTVASVKRLPDGFGKAQLKLSEYRITAGAQTDWQAAANAVEKLLQKTQVTVERKDKPLTIDVAEQIPHLAIVDGELQLHLAATDSASLRPTDVLQLLGFDDWIERGGTVTRTRVHLHREFDSEDPRQVASAAAELAIEDSSEQNSNSLTPHTQRRRPCEHQGESHQADPTPDRGESL